MSSRLPALILIAAPFSSRLSRYSLAKASEETNSLTRKVRNDDFAAAAVKMIRKLSKELAEKNERLREIEYVDPNDFPPPPAPNQIEPIVPAIPPPLAVFDEFDYFPEPQPAPWPGTEYIAGLAVGADQVQSAIKSGESSRRKTTTPCFGHGARIKTARIRWCLPDIRENAQPGRPAPPPTRCKINFEPGRTARYFPRPF